MGSWAFMYCYLLKDIYYSGSASQWNSIVGDNDIGIDSSVTVRYEGKFTVTFDSQGGSAVASQSITSGSAATKPSDPIRTGYTFTGWYTDAACTGAYDFSTAVTSDITLSTGKKITVKK